MESTYIDTIPARYTLVCIRNFKTDWKKKSKNGWSWQSLFEKMLKKKRTQTRKNRSINMDNREKRQIKYITVWKAKDFYENKTDTEEVLWDASMIG